MTLYIVLIAAFIALTGVVLALWSKLAQQRDEFYARMAQHAAQQSRRAERQVLNTAKKFADVQERQRNETIIEQAMQMGRGDFDSDWGGLSDHVAGYVAPNSGAIAASEAGAAETNPNRTELSE